MPTSKGFTLIELLITVSIIAILSVIGLVVYTQVLKNGRDAKRQSDLKLIQSALEQYRADQGFYPATITFGGSLTSGTKTYLKEIPKDPIGSPDYSYTAYKNVATAVVCTIPSDCLDYCIYARVENSANEKDTDCTDDINRTLEVTRP